MKTFLYIILFGLTGFFVFTAFFARRFKKKYTLSLLIGKPGSGKTTLMVKLAHKYNKKGWKVYCNVEVPGCYIIEDGDIGKVKLDQNSVLLIDEIALIWNNRNFKKFTDEDRRFWKLYRHYKLKIFAFSQSIDCDKSIRLLATDLFVLVNYFGIYSVAKKVKRKFPVISKDSEGESQITDEYKITPFFLAPFGARYYTFIPRWAKYFNSFDAPELPEKEFKFIPAPNKIGRKKISKREKRILKIKRIKKAVK